MSTEEPAIDRGPIRIYRITLRDGTSSYVPAHQVTMPDGARGLMLGTLGTRFMCHAELDGKWALTYAVDAAAVDNVRLIAPAELRRALDEVTRICETLSAAGVDLSASVDEMATTAS